MQTHKLNEARPGVSYCKLSSSKLVVAMGDMLRIYSFDFCV